MVGSAFLFDLDGTVWNSQPWYDALIRAAGGAVPSTRPVARRLKDVGFTPASFAAMCRSDSPSLQLYDFVADSLDCLAEANFRLGVVTNLPGWMATPMLASVSLDRRFDTVVDYGSTKRHKPKPEPLLEACGRLAVTPGGQWYVGDDMNDGLAARAAGMRFAWASWGSSAAEPPGTSIVLTSAWDLLDIAEDRL